MKRYTCINGREEKVDASVEGEKETVLEWMRAAFPGVREAADGGRVMHAWEFFYEGELVRYETPDGELLYLAEVEDRGEGDAKGE